MESGFHRFSLMNSTLSKQSQYYPPTKPFRMKVLFSHLILFIISQLFAITLTLSSSTLGVISSCKLQDPKGERNDQVAGVETRDIEFNNCQGGIWDVHLGFQN